jgi:hypothetical protein
MWNGKDGWIPAVTTVGPATAGLGGKRPVRFWAGNAETGYSSQRSYSPIADGRLSGLRQLSGSPARARSLAYLVGHTVGYKWEQISRSAGLQLRCSLNNCCVLARTFRAKFLAPGKSFFEGRHRKY